MGLSGRVPHRVDAATKAALLGLLDDAVAGGWTLRRACHELELGEVRAHRWIARRAAGELADKAPGGSPMHGLLDEEAAADHQVDRSTIMRIRTVAKEGALAALAASKPGTAARQRDYELEAAKAENARLSEALKEMAVRLTLVEGKGRWG